MILNLNRAKYHIGDSGPTDKPALLFLHAFPMSSEMWEPQVKYFSRDYRCLVPDLRGFGKSEAPGNVITIPQLADDMADLLNQLDIAKAVVVGSSMGGYIALEMAASHPELLLALVLCHTKAEADDDAGRQKRFDTIQQISEGKYAEFADTFLGNVLSVHTRQNKPEVKQALRENMMEQKDESVKAGLLALASRNDNSPTLPRIHVPTTIITGDEDKLTGPEHAEKIQKALGTEAALHIAENCGHFSNLEQADWFNSRVWQFLLHVQQKVAKGELI